MKQSIITHFLAQLMLGALFLFLFQTNLFGQLWGDELDSIEQVQLERRQVLKATPPIQERVDDKINEHRLLMLAYEWWELEIKGVFFIEAIIKSCLNKM